MNYWVTPEDLTQRWAGLRSTFEDVAKRNGRCLLTIRVISDRGQVVQVIPPTAVSIEPRAAFGNERARLWWSVIRRIRSVSPSSGEAIISCVVAVDPAGQPLWWTTPAVERIDRAR